MGSMVWTSDEARYLKAIFSWQDRFDDEQDGGNRVQTAAARACVGDFRVLMIGAKGVGKTALLTRFCDGSFDGDAPPDPRFVRGGRRPLRIDRFMYSMDVLEMPSQHLIASPDETGEDTITSPKIGRSSPSPTVTPAAMMLEQAIAITEAAIVVYDVCNPASFQQARRLYDRLRQERGMGAGETANESEATKPEDDDSTPPKTSKRTVPKRKSMRFRISKKEQQHIPIQQPPVRSASTGARKKPTRPFALLLVGTKSDADDSERHVAWIDGSKAAAAPSQKVLGEGVPPVPPVPGVPGVTGLPLPSPTFFLEASAKTGDNVNDVFVQIGREILRQREERKRLMEEQEQEHAQNSATASGSSSTTTNNSLLRIKSQTSATTAATRRTFGVLRALGLTFGRRQVATESPVVA
ncbi:hypothetical protein SBRCBS47491_006552 [Sporothrix bragantina]|uniref:Uncharacterized protein n=1 Tax=Sporothrix bragantina TaxID=671064 RepID=A0ABP0C6D8_9PEZI